MKRVLLTGANRGLGLEFTRQLLARGDQVFATARQPDQADELQALANAHPGWLVIVPLEVTDAASIQQAHELVAGHAAALDVLINNAGAMKGAFRTGADPRLGRLEAGDLDRLFAINATAPVMMTQTFLDLLRAGDRPRVVNISSWLGSIADKNMAGYYGYSASKAALNMLTRILAVELRALGVVAIVMHPGWARTAMGGPRATLEAPEAVAGMLRVIDRLTMNDTARFWDYTGHEMAW